MPRRRRAPRQQVVLGVRVRRPSYVIISISLLSFVLLGAFVFTSSQSSVCSSCHPAQAAALRVSVHRAADCYTCHLRGGWWGIVEAKTDEVLRMYPRTLLGKNLSMAPCARVSRKSCTSCHRQLPKKTEVRGLIIRHGTCAAAPRPCDDCHSSIAHGRKVRWPRRPLMDECLDCHERRRAPKECVTCHAGRLDRKERLENGPWQVTHGSNWKKTHGMGRLSTCRTCHDDKTCIRCHATVLPHPKTFMRTHGNEALTAEAECTTCHAAKEFCERCHGFAMPHPVGFLKVHAKQAAGGEDPRCIKCHRPMDCRNCHIAHTHPGRTDGSLGEILVRGSAR